MQKYTLEQAHKIQMDGDLALAEQIYTAILSNHPDNWLCTFFLGTLYLQTHRNGLAVIMFERAGQLHPQSPEIWNNLGTAYKRENFNEEARKALLRSRSLNVDADNLNNLATIYINEGEPEKGERWARLAVKEDPESTYAHWNLSLTLLEQGKWQEGFKEYSWGLRSKDRRNRDYNAALWRGQKNKSVVVYGEQGIGDEIMFASCIPDLKKLSKRVVFDCHPRLIGLFERSFGIKCYPDRKKDEIPWIWKENLDYKIPIGGLPQFFRKTDKDFPGKPYLKPDPDMVKDVRTRLESLGPGPYIGVSWYGGKKKTRNDLRAVPLEKWGEILKQDAQYISLQYTKDHIKEAQEHGLHVIKDVFEDNYDYNAALVCALDLVISVNTSIVHLAGALGQECWCLTPTRRAWRYYEPKPGKMVWYNSVKQYSAINDDWEPALNRVHDDIQRFCEAHSTDSVPGSVGSLASNSNEL